MDQADSIQPKSKGHERLLVLAHANAVPLSFGLSPIPSASFPPKFATPDDLLGAKSFLTERRKFDDEFKKANSKLFGSKPKPNVFDYKEVNRGLEYAVQNNKPAGLVEALLSLGGDVNIGRRQSTNTWKKVAGQNQEVVRSDILPIASQLGSLGLVKLLASRADQITLDRGLPLAIARGDPDVVAVLLEWGADPSSCDSAFPLAVQSGSDDLVELLLRGPKRPSQDCRTLSLIKATAAGSLRKTSALLLTSANADYQNSAALRQAIIDDRLDLVVAIVTAPKPPSVASLDSVLALAYSHTDRELTRRTLLVEVCLCGGAQGQETDQLLLQATLHNQDNLISLMLAYGASVEHEDGSVLRYAISSKQEPLLLSFLKQKPGIPVISKIVQDMATELVSDMSFATLVCTYFIDSGLVGDVALAILLSAVLDRALTGCEDSEFQYKHPVVFKLIEIIVVRGNVDMDYQAGNALCSVTTSAVVDVLQLMLARKPSLVTLSSAFVHAMEIPDKHPKKMFIIKSILDAGATGHVLDEALINSAKRGTPALALTTLLLERASVDHRSGEAICESLRTSCFEQFELLLLKNPTSETLRHVWDSASTIPDARFQYAVYRKLLTMDIGAAPLDKELITAASKGPSHHDICKLLLEHGASVDRGSGSALVEAIRNGNMETLHTLLEQNPQSTSLTPALSVSKTLHSEQRYTVISALSDKGIEPGVLDATLLEATMESPYDPRVVELYLEAGASPDHGRGAAVMHAATILDYSLLSILAPYVKQTSYFSDALSRILGMGDKWMAANALPLVQFLLQKNAKGSRVDDAIIDAAKTHNIGALRLMIPAATSTSVVKTAFDVTVEQDTDWMSDDGLPVVQLLLENGAQGEMVEYALLQSAAFYNSEAVQVLSDDVHDKGTWTMAFHRAIDEGEEWLDEEGLELVDLMLARGASGVPVDAALPEAIDSYATDKATETLIDTLLHYNANVNHEDGLSLQKAVYYNDIPLLLKLIGHGASAHSLGVAASSALMSAHQEDDVIKILKALQDEAIQPDLNIATIEQDPVLLLSLQNYRSSVKILCELADMGADLFASVKIEQHIDEDRGVEKVSPLSWALVQAGDDSIDDPVLMALIHLVNNWSDHGNSQLTVNFRSPTSKTTALMLAAKYKRPAIVASLLEAGAHVDYKDAWERSALFFAASAGDKDCVQILLASNPRVNDGSLQEASRMLHGQIVQLLIEKAHDPNFTSTKHNGRTALGELCCKTNYGENYHRAQLDQTLDELMKGNADPQKKCKTKLPMFLALDNENPIALTSAVLERIMWKYLNDDKTIFTDSDGMTYSPSMYVKKQIYEGPNEAQEELIELLESHGAEDKYYAKMKEVQPEDAIGMPEDIAKHERSRAKREDTVTQELEDHERKQELLHDEAMNKMRLAWDKAEQELEIKARKHNLTMEQQQDLAEQKLANKAVAQQQRVQYDAQLAENKRIDMSRNSVLTRDLKWKEAQLAQRLAHEKREQARLDNRRLQQEKLIGQREAGKLKMQIQHVSENSKLKTLHQQAVMKKRMGEQAIHEKKVKAAVTAQGAHYTRQIQAANHRDKMQEMQEKKRVVAKNMEATKLSAKTKRLLANSSREKHQTKTKDTKHKSHQRQIGYY